MVKRVAVTGALGYLGTKLVEMLHADPDVEIVVIDLVSSSAPDLIKTMGRARLRLIEGDILDLPLDRCFEDVSTVFHLAADRPPAPGVRDTTSRYRVNVEGTRRVAEACADCGAHLLYPSTTSVYAKTSGTVTEADADMWLGPQTDYAESKYRAESGLRALAAVAGLKYHVVRLGTVFGLSSGMHCRNAVQAFCLEAAATGSVTVWESALHQRRPYCHVDDAVRALLFLADDRQAFGSMTHAASHHATVSEIVGVIRTLLPNLEVRTIAHETMNRFSYDVSCDRLATRGFQFHGSLSAAVAQVLRRLSASDYVMAE